MFLRRVVSIAALVMMAAACSSESDPESGGANTTAGSDAGLVKPPEVIASERELRGAWISTVWNGVWPSRTGLDEPTAKAELLAILDNLQQLKMNAAFFQVRPEGDAVYKSSLEPWSRFLTGTQGGDPGWDPLAFAITEGHKRGIEIHAWMNPYRAATSLTATIAPEHVSKRIPSAAKTYGSLLWMDPGVPEVRTHILEVIKDIVTRYDVDGIHFDDYFYPYPVSGATFDDAKSFGAHGGGLGKDDWRRANVDALVRETQALISQTRPDVRFGVSPFGIYRPGTPPGITGLDAWATLYCDPVKWMNEGWVDYLAPQLYWPTTQTAQAFGKLVSWWSSQSQNGRLIFVGHDVTKGYAREEYEAQIALTRAEPNARGSIFFSAKPLASGDIHDLVAAAYKVPTLTPPLAGATVTLPAPAVRPEKDGVTVATPGRLRAVIVHKNGAVDRLVPVVGPSTRIVLAGSGWTVSVVDRLGQESPAVTTM